MQWININEKLPEIGDEVRCWNAYYGIWYGYMFLDDDGKWRSADENAIVNNEYDHPPTHWLDEEHIPEPPKYY